VLPRTSRQLLGGILIHSSRIATLRASTMTAEMCGLQATVEMALSNLASSVTLDMNSSGRTPALAATLTAHSRRIVNATHPSPVVITGSSYQPVLYAGRHSTRLVMFQRCAQEARENAPLTFFCLQPRVVSTRALIKQGVVSATKATALVRWTPVLQLCRFGMKAAH